MEAQFPSRRRAAARSHAGLDGETPVVFRVYEGGYPVPQQLSIVGNHPALGNFVPNTIAMHDDGTNGDEHAGDHVWSYRAMMPAGDSRSATCYTNSGARGELGRPRPAARP